MIVKPYHLPQLMLLLCLLGSKVQADPRCFAFAETYYEQVYCEIKARNPRAALPDFVDFKRNPALTQALLLKPQARPLGMKIVLPKQTSAHTPRQQRGERPQLGQGPGEDTQKTSDKKKDQAINAVTNCDFKPKEIRCVDSVYQIQGNRANSDLADTALSAVNRLVFPAYTGTRGDELAEQQYLLRTYRIYLEKMLAIGLGAATLNYGKFAYLFYDLHEKGVSFVDRFDSMYEFLKKDKRNIRLATQARVPDSLSDSDCYFLDPLWVCSKSGVNFVYQ